MTKKTKPTITSPHSISNMLGLIRYAYGEKHSAYSSLGEFATQLSKIKSKYDRSVSGSTVAQLETRITTRLTYPRMERYAKLSGIPSGILLVITRIVADLRNNKKDDARKLAKGLISLGNHILTLEDSEFKNRNSQKIYYNRLPNRKISYQTHYDQEQMREFLRIYSENGLVLPELDEGKRLPWARFDGSDKFKKAVDSRKRNVKAVKKANE